MVEGSAMSMVIAFLALLTTQTYWLITVCLQDWYMCRWETRL